MNRPEIHRSERATSIVSEKANTWQEDLVLSIGGGRANGDALGKQVKLVASLASGARRHREVRARSANGGNRVIARVALRERVD
jgi:hypothetical protein